jgi:tetratricopeptide (TPR) repeat protein
MWHHYRIRPRHCQSPIFLVYDVADMTGQLSEHPLAELISELSAKSLAGKLQLEHDRIKAVIYFDDGKLLYAAANLRSLRLREYLLKAGINEAALNRYGERRPDLELAKALVADYLLTPAAAEQVQTKQVTDVLRLALSWTEGTWEFDQRARLDEQTNLKIDVRSLLLETGRRTPPKFAASRFPIPSERMSPVSTALEFENLQPAEVFLLSRLDRPATLEELVAVSGVSDNEAFVVLYSLALAGLIEREHGSNVFSGRTAPAVQPGPEKPAPQQSAPPAPPEEKPEADLERFLERLDRAQTHYDVLEVNREASPAQMKVKYYELARRYHPDRFRKADPSLLARTESAFARITQAYDTLRDDRLRANYDAKLAARQKAQQVVDATAKPKTEAPAVTTPTPDKPSEPRVSVTERAEAQFKEALAALETGERKVALGLFAAAANAVPKEARYRAFYGRMLAEHEHTRRTAEAELQAAIKLDPANGQYRVMLAELYRDLGLMLRARGEAERALATDPNNSKARDLLRALKSV